MSIYEFESYTEAIESHYKQGKLDHPEWTLSKIAQQCLMQPSYLTNVLKGRADLNSDQLYRLCGILGVADEETEYLLLLLEFKKTQIEKRRRELSLKIKAIKSSHARAEKKISTKVVELSPELIEKYYLDPFNQLVHIYLTIPKAEKSLDGLAKKFSLSKARMAGILNTLEQVGYVQKKGLKYEVIEGGRHLKRDAAVLTAHHQLMRLKSLDQMQSLTVDEVYSFSATISTTPEVREKLQVEYLKFLKIAEKMVKTSEPKKMYQINFDLFPWELEET